MKVIKIKVKTIILSIIMIFFTIPYFLYFIGEVGYNTSKSVNSVYGKGDISTYTAGFLKIYEKYPTIKLNKGRVYYMLGMTNYNYNKEFLYYYTDSNRVYSYKNGNMEQALIARGYFEEGIALGESDKYYINNLNALINLEVTLGNNERALELINTAKKSKDQLVYEMAVLNEAVYYCKIGDYNKALEICNNEGLAIYKDTINYLKGDYDSIEKAKLELPIKVEDRVNKELINNSLYKNGVLSDINFILDVAKNNEDLEGVSFGEISGKVIVGGKPLVNARIYLDNTGGAVFSNSMLPAINLEESLYKDGQIAYTNENGEFVFNKAMANINYQIAIAVPSALADAYLPVDESIEISVAKGEKKNIDIVFNKAVEVKSANTDFEKDEIVIKYNKISDAESYGVSIMPSNSAVVIYTGSITNSDEIRIPLTNGSLQSFTILSADEIDGKLVASRKYYLGLVDEKEVTIEVIAYDKDENIISISKSFNKVKLNKKKLNEGEKLILDGKFDEGLEFLNKKLNEETENVEYIYPIMRYAYENGNIELGDELLSRIEEINKTGFDKAMRTYYVRE